MRTILIRGFALLEHLKWFEVAVFGVIVFVLQSCSQGATQKIHSNDAISSVSANSAFYAGGAAQTQPEINTIPGSSQNHKYDFIYRLHDDTPVGNFPRQSTQSLAIRPDARHVVIGNSTAQISVWSIANAFQEYTQAIGTLRDGPEATVRYVVYN